MRTRCWRLQRHLALHRALRPAPHLTHRLRQPHPQLAGAAKRTHQQELTRLHGRRPAGCRLVGDVQLRTLYYKGKAAHAPVLRKQCGRWGARGVAARVCTCDRRRRAGTGASACGHATASTSCRGSHGVVRWTRLRGNEALAPGSHTCVYLLSDIRRTLLSSAHP